MSCVMQGADGGEFDRDLFVVLFILYCEEDSGCVETRKAVSLLVGLS